MSPTPADKGLGSRKQERLAVKRVEEGDVERFGSGLLEMGDDGDKEAVGDAELNGVKAENWGVLVVEEAVAMSMEKEGVVV